MIKVLVSDKLSEAGIKILEDAGFVVDCKYKLSPQQLKDIISDYDAIIIRSETKLTKDIIEKADKMRVIGRAGVGLDNVDLDAATKKGIIVMNSPAGNTISTCEHTFALILASARNLVSAHISLKNNREWERSKFKGIELYSKVLGIIGLGRIGKEVAKRALAFGMSVLAYDPFITVELAEKIGVKLVSLEELLKNSDFITIHTPLTEETKNMISTKEFELMKPTAILINCARGEIVDEEALYIALKEKRIAKAALDVFSEEPPLNSKLLELDNIIVTPHLAASTEEAQTNVAVEIAYAVRDALLGKAIRNAANYAQLDQETYRFIEPYFVLTEKMGRFISQVIEGGAKQITIYYLGEISNYQVDVLTSSFMKGFLSRWLEDDVNYINSLEIAKDRGIQYTQIKNREEKEYVNSIRVSVVTDKSQYILEGTLFANKESRFVKMDDIYIEVAPTKHMLVVRNHDRPGVIGFLGTVLAKNNINIADMSLGRKAPADVALTILNLDSPLNDEIIKELTANKDIIWLKYVKL